MKFDPQQPCFFLNPSYLAVDGEEQAIIDPATLQQVGVYAEPSASEIEAILERVNAAQRAWAGEDSKSRAKILHRLANAIESADMSEVARLMTLETGKPYPEAIGEIANIPPVFRYFAEMARDHAGHIAGSMQSGSFQYQIYQPLGVSVHIVPYNFPLILGCWTMAASLAAGNGVVLKPSPAGTLCALEFMRYFDVLPDDLVACIPGGAAVGMQLINSVHCHAVAFTGSVESGKTVAVAAAGHLKPAIIEAGGSDPFIVSRHANIEVAAAACVTAAFLQSGQVCTSAERIYVVDEVHDAFVEALVKRTRQLRIGNGLAVAEIGPLINEAARARVMRLVEDALSKGASIELGGRIPPDQPLGWFYEPTILSGCDTSMAVLQQESFGPIASIVRVKDFDEALRQANATRFGLGACLFSDSLEEAMEAIDRFQAGMVWVNNPLVDNDALAFGGIKNSGIGRALGRQGLDAFRNSKMVVLDHKAREADWWYPYPDDWFYDGGKGGGRKHS